MSANPLAPLVGSLYGPYFLGTVMCTAFYGVTCMQTFFYYVHYQNDPLYRKIFVAIMWILDTIHEALTISGSYKYIMGGLVNPLSFGVGNPELVLLYLLTALVAVPTQCYLVYRIYLFSKKNIIAPLVMAPIALVEIVASTVYIAKALYSANGSVHVVDFTELNGGIFAQLGIVCLSIAAGADVLIAIFMTYLLIREQAATHFARTAHILQRLTVFAVNTGIWTATFALLTIVFLHVYPTKVLYALFIVPLGSIYCNTLLANLNGRAYMRGSTADDGILELVASSHSQASENTGDDKQLRETKLVPGVHDNTLMVMFPDDEHRIPTAASYV